MVLSQNTPVIALDEPTTYMDVQVEKSFISLIRELKDKMSKEIDKGGIDISGASSSATGFVSNSTFSEAAEALTVLGYDKSTIATALKGVDPSVKDVGEIIRLALKNLAR